MAQAPNRVDLVSARLANFPRLDPRAALAVFGTEGLSGGIGDGGHAFGPAQLNNAGGVITGKFAGQSPEQINQWAWSPAGIDYALAGINRVAAGLHGQAAINAIVSQFERPQDIPREITRATQNYGGLPSTFAPPAGAITSQMTPQTQAISNPLLTQMTAPQAAPVKPVAPLAPAGPNRAASQATLKLALQLLGFK